MVGEAIGRFSTDVIQPALDRRAMSADLEALRSTTTELLARVAALEAEEAGRATDDGKVLDMRSEDGRVTRWPRSSTSSSTPRGRTTKHELTRALLQLIDAADQGEDAFLALLGCHPEGFAERILAAAERHSRRGQRGCTDG